MTLREKRMSYEGPLIQPSLIRHCMDKLGMTKEEAKQHIFNTMRGYEGEYTLKSVEESKE